MWDLYRKTQPPTCPGCSLCCLNTDATPQCQTESRLFACVYGSRAVLLVCALSIHQSEASVFLHVAALHSTPGIIYEKVYEIFVPPRESFINLLFETSQK